MCKTHEIIKDERKRPAGKKLKECIEKSEW
jgi:hypothetical protein